VTYFTQVFDSIKKAGMPGFRHELDATKKVLFFHI